MLADDSQLDRWRRLLAVPAEHFWADPRTLPDRCAAGDGRPALLACLHAIDLMRGHPNDLGVYGAALLDRASPLGDVLVRRPAAQGGRVAGAVWYAFVLHEAGLASAEDWLRATIGSLDPVALVFTVDDNPEPWWQAEMIILHALHSFALRSRDRGLVDKTLACGDFHLREIQPDHATNEPWAVHAYASHADGNVTAETLWHAAYIQHGGELGFVARMLAREASTSLATWLSR